MSTPDTSSAPAPNATIPEGSAAIDVPKGSDLPRCPACLIGLLYPIAVDPDATHEAQPATREGDPNAHPHFVASGGAVVLRCFLCGRSSSHPMNAGGS